MRTKYTFSIPLTTIGFVLIVLKLAGIIDWSWWVVTMPLWGGFVFFTSMLLLFVFIVWIKNIIERNDK